MTTHNVTQYQQHQKFKCIQIFSRLIFLETEKGFRFKVLHGSETGGQSIIQTQIIINDTIGRGGEVEISYTKV